MAETKTRRRCREPGCPTLLSRYNAREHCAIHERENPPSNVDGSWTGRFGNNGRGPLVIEWPEGEYVVPCPICGRASGGRKSLRFHIARSHGRKVTYLEEVEE